MKKILFSILLILTVCTSFSMVTMAEGEHVVDMADLLTETEENDLRIKLDEISARQEMDIVLVTVYSLDSKTVQDYADDFFIDNSYGYGTDQDGILLLVAMDSREWHIATHGYAITAFTDAGLDYISEQFLDDLSDAYYADAFNTYADLCDDFITQAKSGEAYDINNMPKEAFEPIATALLSLVIGFVVALIACTIMKGKLKSVRSKSGASDYTKPGSLNITNANEFFLYRHVNRRKKPENTSSSGGGGSSVHTSSSGSSFGGRSGKF